MPCANISRVSIPGGKPLHEPPGRLRRRSALIKKFQSLAGSPSTSHAASRASRAIWLFLFQSLAGSPSTSHLLCYQYWLARSTVSIPGGKPLHEPLALLPVLVGAILGFNPWREAPPRATLIEAAVSREKG